MLKIYKVTFDLELMTGLHIGGSSDTFDIGGADSTVIKNPLTHEPYIPGSSIKGKLRSLLTQKYGKFNGKEKDIVFEDDEKGKTMRNLFEPVDYGDDRIQVSKAIFRDALLTDESRANLEKHLGSGVYTEIKAENKISLLKGKAERKGEAEGPRFIERVPAGAVFGGEILLQVFDKDNEECFKEKLKEAINMLELNYLGAGGTRGYGKVKVDIKEDFEEVKV